MRLLIAFILCSVSVLAQVQQSQYTTNKLTSSTGLTNVVTATNAFGVKSYDVRLDVTPGAGISLATNGTQLTISAAGAGLGDVSGPASATNLAVAIFDGTSGKQIKDGGVTLSTLLSVGSPANTVVGPGTAVTSGRLASWSGTSGTNIADSGYSASSFATSAHTHAQLHDRSHSVVSASDHSDWPATVDLTELGYLDGVTSGIQSQISGKQDADSDLTDLADGSLSGSKVGSGIDAGNITAGTLSTDRYSAYGDLGAESKIGTSGTQVAAGDHTHAQLHDRSHGITSASDHSDWPSGLDTTELGYVNGVTSAIQTQLDAKQPASANLTNWSALATSAKQDYDADLTTWAGITPAANVGTFLATPSSANLRGAVTDENGTGALLFDGASSLALGSSSFTAITNSALTAGRVIFSGTTKEQADDADLTFATDTLTATKVSAPTAVYAAALTVTNTATLATVAGAIDAGGATSLEIPNSDDPDVDAAGELSWDTDGWLRAYDGSNQVAVGRKLYQIDATVYKPNDLDDAQRDGVWIWSNQSGMSFVVTGWAAQSSSDDTDLNIEEIDADGQNNTTVDAVSITTNGTGIYYASDTTITAATIETGHILVLDFDDTDTPSQVHITIYGYFDANVN